MGSKIRQEILRDLLKYTPAVLVKDLAQKFDVSESTIRRDLDELEAIGVIRRVHGGAILEGNFIEEEPFEVRNTTQRNEKSNVGKAAATIVENNTTIFIDGGTTTPFIVHHLSYKKHLVVVTVGLNIATRLASQPSIKTILLGGELHLETQTLAGNLSIQAIETCGLTFDLAFISAVGVSAEYGATNQLLDRIVQKQKAIELSRKVAVVVDGSKIGKTALAKIIAVDDIDTLITDSSARSDKLEAIRALGQEIIVAEDSQDAV